MSESKIKDLLCKFNDSVDTENVKVRMGSSRRSRIKSHSTAVEGDWGYNSLASPTNCSERDIEAQDTLGNKSNMKDVVRKYIDSEETDEVKIRVGSMSKLRRSKIKSSPPNWEDEKCHSPPTSPALRNRKDRDSGLPESIKIRYRESNHQAHSTDDDQTVRRLSGQSESEYGSDNCDSPRNSVHGAQKDDKYHSTIKQIPSGHNEQKSDNSSTSSKRSVVLNEQIEYATNDDVSNAVLNLDETSDYQSDTERQGRVVAKSKTLYRIADELLQTEKTYVKNLNILDQVFQKKIIMVNKKQHFIPPEIIPQIFSNIGSIYKFHSEFLLPKLEERMQIWYSLPKIGDIMKESAPFFKLYTEYMQNYDNSRNVIEAWGIKSTAFADFLYEIQRNSEYSSFSLFDHMIVPVQRLPRYELLLKDFIKHLPEDSEDLPDAKEALSSIMKALVHANEAMKNDNFYKLMKIQSQLGSVINLITPTRKFIKEGRITKVSARRGEKQDRYLFLFNDMLLICSPDLLGWQLHTRLDVNGMEVVRRDNSECNQLENDEETLDIPNTFYVKSRKKIVQFCQDQWCEEFNWCETINHVIEQHQEKRRSFIRCDTIETSETECSRRHSMTSEFELGEMAPKWVKNQEVNKCMNCGAPFTKVKWRHHCRACGFVVCGNCSAKKIPLSYDDYNLNKVCDTCYEILKSKKKEIISGYLNFSKYVDKDWKKTWFSVCSDFCLYYYKTWKDIAPADSYNLKISTIEEVESSQNVFKITCGAKIFYLCADTIDRNQRWIKTIKQLTQPDT